MSLIIAARFDTFEYAECAAKGLMAMGVENSDLHTFFVKPESTHDRLPDESHARVDPKSKGALPGVVIGAAVVGVIGAIIGAIIAYSRFADALIFVVSGAGVGGYIGSLIGAMYGLGRGRSRSNNEVAVNAEDTPRVSGVLLAVNTTPENEKRIASILLEAGGHEVERAQGHWQDGRWKDFDPMIRPHLEKEFPGSLGTSRRNAYH